MANHKRKITKSFILYMGLTAAIVAFFIVGVFFNNNKEYTDYKKVLMGTVVEIIIMDGVEPRFDEAADAAFAEIKRLEAVFSNYKPGSEASRISSHSGEPVKVSADVIHVVEEALAVSKLTEGAFDPTVGALASVWGLSGEKGELPATDEVKKILPLVDYRKVSVDEAKETVALLKKGMTLNLGGVAKGFIVAAAADALKSRGVRRAIIKAGGDMFLFDTRGLIKKASFIVGIRDPRDEKGVLGEIYLYGGAVATSGDYERFFMKGGKRYHHILDPKSGWPARRSRSVTIISKDPAMADALSTGVFVLGPKKGMALIEALKGVEAVIVDASGGIHTTSGFKGRIFPQKKQ